jgi:hypothetical protein
MAHAGGFPSRRGPRDRIVAWPSDVKKALNAEMTRGCVGDGCDDDNLLEQAVASGRLVEGKRGK